MRQVEVCSSNNERLSELERALSRMKWFAAFVLLGVAFAASAGLYSRTTLADDAGVVLHVRGIVVEDSQGRPRILIGAPAPKAKGRTRTDDAFGIVLLGENGADQVVLGAPTPDGMSAGKVTKRIAAGAGLLVNDAEGNERGGFGVLANGRGVACLDYPAPSTREAVCMGVVPEAGFAGFLINAPSGDSGERAEMAVIQDGTSLFKLADANGEERAMMVVQGDKPAKFLVIDPKAKTQTDILQEPTP